MQVGGIACTKREHAYSKNLPSNAGNAGDGVLSLSWEDPLEKEMATHSSILDQNIPFTEEPGRL